MRCLNLTSLLLLIAFIVTPTEALLQEEEQTPKTPAAVRDVLYVRPFTLHTGYLFTWIPERPIVDRGVIVVLSVDPALVVPRNSPEPILYAGDRVVERLNWGNKSGHVIAIIPGSFDVTSEPIWFGSPGLPGRVSLDDVRSELAAINRTVEAISKDRADAVTEPEIQAQDFAELLRGELAELVLRFSPQESDLAHKWRLPEARVVPDPAIPVVDDAGGELR
jgi:hypothetical protein